MNPAYVAGIIDGEGSIGFSRVTETTMVPRVSVGNTNKKLLDDLKESFGGTVHVCHKEGDLGNNKPTWEWKLSSSKSVKFLEIIFPWLRIKRPQVVLLFVWNLIRPGSGRQLDDEGRAILTLIKRQINWLNRRGKRRTDDVEPIEGFLHELS